MKLNRLTLNIGYAVVSTVLSAVIAAGGSLLFFVNPINWKNYRDFGPGDEAWSWVSNGFILILVLSLIVTVWTVLWKLRRKVANQSS